MANKSWGNFSVMEGPGGKMSYTFWNPRTSAHVAAVRAMQTRFRFKKAIAVRRQRRSLQYQIAGWRGAAYRVRRAEMNRRVAQVRLGLTRAREAAARTERNRIRAVGIRRLYMKVAARRIQRAFRARTRRFPSLFYVKGGNRPR